MSGTRDPRWRARRLFAMSPAERRMTLAEVGKMVGLTNERVRQIQIVALDKIRDVLDTQYLRA